MLERLTQQRKSSLIFFGKLGSLYGRLNLISKLMQVYNADETGVTIVHKTGKVIAELGRRHVYSVTSVHLLKGAVPTLFFVAFQLLVSCCLLA